MFFVEVGTGKDMDGSRIIKIKSMRKTKNFSIKMLAVLTAAIIFGFMSCKDDDNKEPEEVGFSYLLIGKWYFLFDQDTKYYIEFKTDGTYSFVNENETINGNYRIIERIEDTTYYSELNNPVYDTSMFKMLASGSNSIDQMWVYHMNYLNNPLITIHFYFHNELVKDLGSFRR